MSEAPQSEQTGGFPTPSEGSVSNSTPQDAQRMDMTRELYHPAPLESV